MNRPLTARHLVIILVIIGFGAWWFLNVRAANRSDEHSRQVVHCVLMAPAGWPCETDPMGYPGYTPGY